MAAEQSNGQAADSGAESEGKFLLTTMKGKEPIHRVLLDNWQSGVTVSMVSVPLSISLGIASVAGNDPAAPTMGVATAFWGGFCASIFGSSDHNIVGPAGALSGMLNSYTIQFGGAGVLPYLSMISAGWITLFYLLNLQKYLLLMPKAVFEGFTFAVAIIIGLNQMGMAFALAPRPKHEHFYENVIESFKHLDTAQAFPTVFFVVTCAILLALAKYLPKINVEKHLPKTKEISVPWTVIIPLFTLIFGYLSASDNFGGVKLPTLKDKYGVLKARIVELPEYSLSYYADGKIGALISASFGIAFVAELETLISAKIAEQKKDWGFSETRETLGLIVSHAVCGITGALPPTGVFVRTALNLQLGATHKLSQFINAVCVFLISVIAMPVFSYLPQASVAALLIFASVRMAPIPYIRELFRSDMGSFFVLMLTMLVCVFMDPVYGLIIGMVVALLRDAAETALADSRLTVTGKVKDGRSTENDSHPAFTTGEDTDINKVDTDFGRRISVSSANTLGFDKDVGLASSRSPLEALASFVVQRMRKGEEPPQDDEESYGGDAHDAVVLYEPIGPVAYLGADKHSARLKALLKKKPDTVVLCLELATRVDHDGSEALGKMVKQLQAAGVGVEVVLPKLLENGVAGKSCWLAKLKEDGHVHRHRADATKAASDREGAKGAENDGMLETV